MSEQLAKMQDSKYVVLDESGKAVSRRAHMYKDCTTLRSDNGNIGIVGTSEMALLGLKVCSVCERRKTGGPAIEVLEGFFGEDWPPSLEMGAEPRDAAWAISEYLKERGFYIAQRKPKTDE